MRRFKLSAYISDSGNMLLCPLPVVEMDQIAEEQSIKKPAGRPAGFSDSDVPLTIKGFRSGTLSVEFLTMRQLL